MFFKNAKLDYFSFFCVLTTWHLISSTFKSLIMCTKLRRNELYLIFNVPRLGTGASSLWLRPSTLFCCRRSLTFAGRGWTKTQAHTSIVQVQVMFVVWRSKVARVKAGVVNGQLTSTAENGRTVGNLAAEPARAAVGKVHLGDSCSRLAVTVGARHMQR